MGGLGICRLFFVYFCFNLTYKQPWNLAEILRHNKIISLRFSLLCLLAEEGELYVFYGGSSFPSGNATRGCQKIDPCPGEKVIKIVPVKEIIDK